MPLTVKVLAQLKGHSVLEVSGVTGNPPPSPALYFKADMAICADGAPNAYHPNSKSGLDKLSNAGSPGDWWALVTDNKGNPLVQGPHDPFPGFYYSMTAMSNPEKKPTDPGCFVDARYIPYVVLPESDYQGAALGDLCLVFNLTNQRSAGAIFAEVGPDVGEGSMALAALLGIKPDPRNGDPESHVVAYFIFKGTSQGWRDDAQKIQADVLALANKWGGIEALQHFAVGH